MLYVVKLVNHQGIIIVCLEILHAAIASCIIRTSLVPRPLERSGNKATFAQTRFPYSLHMFFSLLHQWVRSLVHNAIWRAGASPATARNVM